VGEWGRGGTRGDEGGEGDEEVGGSTNYQLPMPNAPCPMPHAQ